MPFKSKAQQRFMYAVHPELAREFQAETPKNVKLPEKVKAAYFRGRAEAFDSFGLRQAGEELRLQLPRREFHGHRAAFKVGKKREEKQAEAAAATQPLEPQAHPDNPVERFTQMLDGLSTEGKAEALPAGPLERDPTWGSPADLSAGDAGSRVDTMGQPTGIGSV